MIGNDPKILTKLESYQRESLLPINGLNSQRSSSIHQSQPKQLESIFTPNQRPPGGKPFTPYIPTPGYPQPNIHRRFPSSSNYRSSNDKQYNGGSPSFCDVKTTLSSPSIHPSGSEEVYKEVLI